MEYKVTVTRIETLVPVRAIGPGEAIPDSSFGTTEVFSQTVPELNLPAFIRALNPVTRKRKAKVAKNEP